MHFGSMSSIRYMDPKFGSWMQSILGLQSIRGLGVVLRCAAGTIRASQPVSVPVPVAGPNVRASQETSRHD